LGRAPEDIRVGEVFRVMEGPIAPMDCVSEDESEQTCPLIEGCETRPVWMKLRDSIIEAIDSQSLADLITTSPKQAIEADRVATSV
jgi:DNA-binding IscR family transcriptional regulator